MLNGHFTVQNTIVSCCVLLILSSSACVTTPPPRPQKPLSKQNQIAPPAPPKETIKPAAGHAPLVLAPVPDSALADFASRHAISVAQLSESDEALLKRIPNQPQAGSVHEAALVLGIIKSFNPVNLDGQIPKPGLENPSDDASRPEVRNNAASTGLEHASLARGIDLPGALEVNPFLQSAAVMRMVMLAADRGGNSEAFKKRLFAAMNKQFHEWNTLSERFGGSQRQEIPAISVTPAGPSPSISPENSTDGAVSDLHSSDLIVSEAAKFADEGSFEKAIKTLKKIQPDSPLSKLAKDRTLEYSNMAVRDLRRRAAQSFSAAVQATDPGSKGSYLEKAKSLLEEALNRYPDADQLGTVRDNLTVIVRDIDRLKLPPSVGDKRRADP